MERKKEETPSTEDVKQPKGQSKSEEVELTDEQWELALSTHALRI
jgi:hypothetical protein